MAEYTIDKIEYNGNVYKLQDGISGYITGYTETDPKFVASPAYGITANDITNWNGKSDFSGSYTDLTNKPTIPTKTSELTNDSGFLTQHQDISGKVNKSGDTMTGDLTLYVPSGNSPGLIFQRGTLTDNFNDWKIYDKSGFLYFAQRGSGSSAFGDVGYIDTGGVLRSFTIPWGSVTGKPSLVNTITTEAGAHTAITNATGNVSFKVPTKTSHLTNDSGYLTSADIPEGASAYTGTISAVSTTASNGTSNGFARGDHIHNITGATIIDALGYTPADEVDLPEGVLIGSTSDITPTQVLTALQAGRDIYLTHVINVDLSIVATYFDYAPLFGMLVSNIIVFFQGEYYLYALVGMTSDDTWTTSTIALAQKLDIPTTALSSTTGITASTTATKTTLGTADSVIGVQSSTTTASKVTLSGSNSFSASVSNHVLSFSHGAQTVSASDVTVPIKDTSAKSIPNVSVASATVTITDPGHTHQLSN